MEQISFPLLTNSKLANGNLTVPFYGDNNRFWHPFDGFSFDFGIKVNYRLLRDQIVLSVQEENPILVVSQIYNPQWRMTPKVIDVKSTAIYKSMTPNDQLPENFVHASFSRQFFIQAISTSILVITLLFTILICLQESLEVFIAGGVGVFFGVFGLKQILLPQNSDIILFVDIVLWGIVFIFGVGLLMHLSSFIRSLLSTTSKIKDGNFPKFLPHRKVRKVKNKKKKYSSFP